MKSQRGIACRHGSTGLIVFSAAALFCVLAMRAPAAGQEGAPPAAEEQKAVAKAVPETRSVPEMLEDEKFHYDPVGRRDPFKSLMELQPKPKDIKDLPPVQQLDLEKVQISGIVLDEEEGHRAMIKGPTGRTFVVKKGMLIGQNEGEIIEVTLQGVRVVEKFVDFMGRETLKEVFIKARPTQTTGK